MAYLLQHLLRDSAARTPQRPAVTVGLIAALRGERGQHPRAGGGVGRLGALQR